jgi:hypothetical protein
VFQIFDKYSLNITPRNIIAFINEFVTINQILKDSIPEEYIALFIMHKESILENPQERIIKLDFLNEKDTFYKDNEEIIKYLTALAFQVEPDKALDLVYKHSLKRALNNGLSEDIETISKSKIFYNLLIPLLPELENIDKAIICLDNAFEKMEIEPIQNKQVWDDIFKLIMKKFDVLPIDYNNVLQYQLALIRYLSDKYIQEYLFKLFRHIYESEKDFTSVGYFKIENIFRQELVKRDFDIDNMLESLPSKKISPEEYIKLVENAKEKYKEVNLICSPNELDVFLVSKDITELNKFEFTKHLTEKNDLKRYKKKLNDFYLQYLTDYSNLPIIIERLKDINDVIDASKLQPSIIVNMYNNFVKQKSDFIYDLIAMRLSVPQFQDINFNNIFVNYLNNDEQENEVTIKTANVIQNYITFGNLLINLKTMNIYPLYVNITYHILLNKSGKKANIVSILQNFDMICGKANIDTQLLINNLSGWLGKLKEDEGKYKFNETLSLSFVKEILKSDTELANYCIERLKKHLDDYTKDEWKQSITQNSSYEIQITNILDYKYNAFASEAMHELLLELTKSDVKSVNRKHYAEIINHMVSKGSNFTKTFNSVRDLLCQKGELSNEEFLFWGEWLFLYSKLETKQEVLRTILPVSLLDNNDCLKIIVTNKNVLPKIIKAAGDESDGFIDGLKARLEKKPDLYSLIEIAKILDIKMLDKETKGES